MMSDTHIGVTVYYTDEDGEECEDNFGYYGPVPDVNDLFALDTEGLTHLTAAPDGFYLVQRRIFHFPARGWEVFMVQVDDGDEAEHTPGDSDEEE